MKLSQWKLIIIVIRIINILATRSKIIYLDRRSYRATLILSNLINSIKTLFRNYSIIDYYYLKKVDDILIYLTL